MSGLSTVTIKDANGDVLTVSNVTDVETTDNWVFISLDNGNEIIFFRPMIVEIVKGDES